ncbi:MAG: efflux RND transporter permease subunit [Thermoanaerobaculales bacterium]|jgi:multidrug efflux pump subunit AcrB|nr:efflux RND transporter permease subunit [Thermoanaerobaculales bacterium]
MDIARIAIQKKTVTLVLTAALAIGGVFSFLGLGQLEDPEFTIFTAIVQTPYSGASPEEVELEVTDRLETAIQTMGQVEHVTSISRAGLSLIIVDLWSHTDQDEIPQAWDELRRKVGDTQFMLPPGAGTSVVNDDWGDVYGALFAITGPGYTLAEIEDYAKLLRRELLMVDGVGAVELWGVQTEVVNVEVSRAKLAQLGLSPQLALATLSDQGSVVADGRLHVEEQHVRVATTGAFDSLDEMGDVLIRGQGSDSMIRLDDVATITRGYYDPPQDLLLFNGHPAVGLGVATVEGGNVVDTGANAMRRLAELEGVQPIGMSLNPIYFQPQVVTEAVNGFLINLAEALVIVIGLLMLFMGLRSGLLIGSVLLLDILGTFIYMSVADISLQRISLGALIIALGMLVDNAIVVTEGILVRLQRGMDRVEAASLSVKETMWPLLGATIVAILAFASISVSDDASGEFLSSLFLVVASSLLLSWLLAVTVTPLLGVMFLEAAPATNAKDPYDRPFFHRYRAFLSTAIRRRWFTLAVMAALLFSAVVGFGFVKQSFFPDSGQPQFYIDFWKPEGSHIRNTEADVNTVTEWLLQQEGVESVTAFIGRGGSRFMLTYSPEMPSSAFAQLLITVEDAKLIDDLKTASAAFLKQRIPNAEYQVHRFVFGPGGGSKIEARLKGDDPEVLRELAEEVKAVMRADGNTKDVRDDWRQRVPVIRPLFAEAEARQAGVSRSDLASSLQAATSGIITGLYREGDTLLPIIFRLPEEERSTAGQLNDALVWSSTTGRALPVNQVTTGMATEWEDPIIRRYDRRRTISVKADPSVGVASPVFERLRPQIEAIELPPGYEIEWGGEYESSGDANRMLMASVPLFFTLMILIVVALFNTIRQPIIVFMTVPLAIIGVTAGLLVTGQAFGFVALLGFLSLSGMLIKNSVVLLDQIDINLEAGQKPFEAVLDAGVSRLRPVAMAAFTTVLGMTPLVFDIFWRGMAVTIMSGLTFATVLTLVIVPVLYATFYRVHAPNTESSS